jgi:hypothetical protein
MKNYRIRAMALLSGLLLVFSFGKTTSYTLNWRLKTMNQKDQINNVSSIIALHLLKDNSVATIPQYPKNAITQAKIDLGELLFHETGLALNPKKKKV